jgi:hypothetical protein
MDEAAAEAFAWSWYDAWNSILAQRGLADELAVGPRQLAAEVIYLDAQRKIRRYGAHYASGPTT